MQSQWHPLLFADGHQLNIVQPNIGTGIQGNDCLFVSRLAVHAHDEFGRSGHGRHGGPQSNEQILFA